MNNHRKTHLPIHATATGRVAINLLNIEETLCELDLPYYI